MQRIQVIDSHTGGEPTRVVVAGGPDLGGGNLVERPIRPAEKLAKYPASTQRVFKPQGCGQAA